MVDKGKTQIVDVRKPSLPTALPPQEAVLITLSSSDRELLHKLLSEETSFVEHDSFNVPDYDERLFGVAATLTSANSTRFITPVKVVDQFQAKGGRMTALRGDQEQRLFQRYNYARMRVAKILEQYAGRRLTSRAARHLLAWESRALEVRSLIVTLNVPLVLAMAKRARFNSVDFNEMVSEGNMALLRSVDKFDWSKGFKFSTYSCRAILKSFSRVVMKATRYRGQFPVEFDPSIEKSDFSDRRREGQETDCVEDLKAILLKNLADLNDIEQTVIRERFALAPLPDKPSEPKTLEQVGQIIGVTKERVRQIQNKALRKIRKTLEDVYLAA